MRFEKGFKFYSNDQWLLCKEQTWFNMVNILYSLMLNQKIINKKYINYIEKLVIKRLIQTTNKLYF
jgi:hypothetical protein